MTVVNSSQSMSYDATTKTTHTHVFGFTPTVGNLLVLLVGLDKSTDGMNPPVGWVEHVDKSGLSVSISLFSKISDGTETEVTYTWARAQNGGMSWVGEVSGYNDTVVDIKNPAYSDTTVTSITLPTIGPVSGPGFVIAFSARDSGAAATSTTGPVDATYIANDTGNSGEPPLTILTHAIASGASADYSWTWGSADQASCAGIVFAKKPVSVANDLQYLYDLNVLAATDSQFLYNLYNLINKDQNNIWNVQSVTLSDNQLLYQTYVLTAQDLNTPYALRSIVPKNIETLYNIQALAGVDYQTLYNLFANVSKINELPYHIYGRIAQELDTSYALRSLTFKEVQTLYSIQALAGIDYQTLYNVYAAVSKTNELLYNILAFSSKEFVTSYAVRQSTGTNVQVLYDILQNATAVGEVVSLVWSIRQASAGDFTAFYNLISHTGSLFDNKYNTLIRTNSESSLLWNINILAAQNVQTLWNLRQIIAGESFIRWKFEIFWYLLTEGSSIWTQLNPGTDAWTQEVPATDTWNSVSNGNDIWTPVISKGKLWTPSV